MGSIFDNRAALPLEEEEEKVLAPTPTAKKQLKTQTKTLLLLMLLDVLLKTALVKQTSVMKKLLKNTLRTFVHSM